MQDRRRLERGVRLLLEGVGRSRLGPEFERTVERVTQVWSEELLRGYAGEPSAILSPIPAGSDRGWVVVRDLRFSSLCVHHLLPFFGKAHIAFVPDRCLVGLSKLARLVDCLARRLQIQETMTRQILEEIDRCLRPRGAAVIVEAEHLCMTVRGVRSHGSRIITAAFSGILERDRARRRAIESLIDARSSARSSRASARVR
ncbi:MAG: GTP cyclohydrolase I [Acidobacteriota bacterium]